MKSFECTYAIETSRVNNLGMITEVAARPPLPLSVMLGGLGLVSCSEPGPGLLLYERVADDGFSRLRYFAAGQQPFEAEAIVGDYSDNLRASIADYSDGQAVTVNRLELDPIEFPHASALNMLIKNEDQS